MVDDIVEGIFRVIGMWDKCGKYTIDRNNQDGEFIQLNEHKTKTMEIGDTVNVKCQKTHREGTIMDIRDRFSDEIIYSEPIAHVKGDGVSGAVLMESDLEFKDGEWWEVRL